MAGLCDASKRWPRDTRVRESQVTRDKVETRDKGRRDALTDLPNVVLVHGAWGSASSWYGVTKRLQANGFHVRAPQFPLSSVDDDVARLRQVLEFLDGATILAGHCYGGQIITALGQNAMSVAGLVYVAAYGPDEGESLGAILAQRPPPPALAHLFVDARGSCWIPEDDYVDHLAADVDPVCARVMYAAQQALPSSLVVDHMGYPAWRSLPSWYLVAQDDAAIPADAQRRFAERMGATTVEVPSGHLVTVSHPQEVTDLIEQAADAATL
jgi:pimeloyl-ACP methyl ester carboxylesterase